MGVGWRIIGRSALKRGRDVEHSGLRDRLAGTELAEASDGPATLIVAAVTGKHVNVREEGRHMARQTAGAATQGRAAAQERNVPAADNMAQVSVVVTDASGNEVLSKAINGGFDELPAAIETANQVVKYGEGITRARA